MLWQGFDPCRPHRFRVLPTLSVARIRERIGEAGQASLDLGAWWLAGAVLLGGFLLTIAFGRLFLFAYWRPSPLPLPPVRTGWTVGLPLAALTILVIGFGVLPEQLLQFARSAADGLADPSAYIFSVFPEGAMR